MSALGTCDHAVGTDNDVTVKVYVNLKRCKDHEIQLIDISALVERVRILGRRDLEVVRICLDGLDGTLIEILGINELVYEAFRQQLTHRSCDSAEAKSHMDASLFHDLSEGDRGGDGSSADTCLVGETFLKIWGVDNKLCAVIRHHDLSDIRCRFCSTCRNLCRISNLIYDTNVIHIYHGDACRNVRERNEAVCHGNNLICILGIDHRVG